MPYFKAISVFAAFAVLLSTAATVSPLASAQERASKATRSVKKVELKNDQPLLIAQAKFGFRLLDQLSQDGAKGNLSVSPGSLASVLAFFDLGVDDRMREALIKTLDFTPEEGRARLAALRAITKELAADKSEDNPLALANALFSQVSIQPGTLKKLKAEGITLEKADLTSAEDVAQLNGWVSKHTRGLIPTILDRPLPRPGFVAVNALHFKDRWKFAFDATRTRPLPFQLLEGDPVDVPMMQLASKDLSIRQNQQFIAIELPYANDRFSMVVVTTQDKPAPIAEFASVAYWLALDSASFTKQDVVLSLPKFEIKLTTDVLAPLAALGLEDGMQSETALAGFAPNLYIAGAPHRTVISVDESGTRAAAVSAVVAINRSASSRATRIDVDKPFMFALRDKKSGLILMSGYVGNPAVE
jgi:serine protease inhibitor